MKLIDQHNQILIILLFGLILSTCQTPEIEMPKLISINPIPGVAGQPIYIKGEQLQYGNWVHIGETKHKISLDGNTITAVVPEKLPHDIYDIFVETAFGNSNRLQLEIVPSPIFDDDYVINVEDTLKIVGQGFIEPILVNIKDQSGKSTKLENPEIINENLIAVFIPIATSFNISSTNYILEVSSNSITSPAGDLIINNPKIPKIKTSSITNILSNDTIYIKGDFLLEDQLKIEFDDITADMFFSVNDSLAIVVPEEIKEVGFFKISTKYGFDEINYSTGDVAERIPLIELSATSRFVYSDDSIKLFGENFSSFPIKVLLKPVGMDTIIIENSNVNVISNNLLLIARPTTVSEGIVVIKNSYGISNMYQFETIEPPSIQTILPKGNPEGGPIYIYGPKLIFTNFVIFKDKNSDNQIKISVDKKFSRCFDADVNQDSCDIVALNVPNIPPGDYEITVEIQENNTTKINKDGHDFTVLSEYNPNSLAGFGSPNIVLPNPPIASIINSVQNTWFITNNNSPFGLDDGDGQIGDLFEIKDREFPPNVVGVFRKDASFVKLKVQGLDYQGQFDSTYYDDDFYLVRKMVLLPVDQGKVLILLDKTVAIDSLSQYQLVQGTTVPVYGYFPDNNYEVNFQSNNIDRATVAANKISDTVIEIVVPNSLASGPYKVYAVSIDGGFNSNRKPCEVIN